MYIIYFVHYIYLCLEVHEQSFLPFVRSAQTSLGTAPNPTSRMHACVHACMLHAVLFPTTAVCPRAVYINLTNEVCIHFTKVRIHPKRCTYTLRRCLYTSRKTTLIDKSNSALPIPKGPPCIRCCWRGFCILIATLAFILYLNPSPKP